MEMFTEYNTVEVVHKSTKVFNMNSLASVQGLVILNKSCFNVLNFQKSLADRVLRRENHILIQSAAFIAYYNTIHKRILIVKNRITGDTGVFDYV